MAEAPLGHKNKQLQIKSDTENAQKLRQAYAGPSEFTLPIWWVACVWSCWIYAVADCWEQATGVLMGWEGAGVA